MPPPVPPRVKLGLMMSGNPMSLGDLPRLVDIVGKGAFRQVHADAQHGLFEFVAVLGPFDRRFVRADELDVVAGEDAALGEFHGGIEAGLAAHGGEDRIGPLALDDLLHDFGGDRFDVGPVGHVRVGHDGRGVGVDEDDLEPLLAQRLARLGTRIVEFARLPDDDGSAADDEYFMYVGSFRHVKPRESVEAWMRKCVNA